jgi:hypothetical protein
MGAYRLYRFACKDIVDEFVVISNLPKEEVSAEYAIGDIYLDCVVEIDGDATSFPCDRQLSA